MSRYKLTREDVIRLYPHHKGHETMIEWILDKSIYASPIGFSQYVGDKTPDYPWSVKEFFTVGKTYPVYSNLGEGEFVIGSDGKGYKLSAPNSWSKVKKQPFGDMFDVSK